MALVKYIKHKERQEFQLTLIIFYQHLNIINYLKIFLEENVVLLILGMIYKVLDVVKI